MSVTYIDKTDSMTFFYMWTDRVCYTHTRVRLLKDNKINFVLPPIQKKMAMNVTADGFYSYGFGSKIFWICGVRFYR